MFPKKLLFGTSGYPVNINPPSSFTTQTVVDLSSQATYATGTIPSTGWYRAKIGAADGDADTGGYAEQIFYAYNGSKYLIWGCNGTSTGYPWPSGNGGDDSYGILGGGGATSISGLVNNVQKIGGKGGGSATGNGISGSASLTDSGAGCGIICGIDEIDPNITTQTESFADHTFSVDTVVAMVLAAGGGGQGNGTGVGAASAGGGGGGGGAYGDGGRAYVTFSDRNLPGTGPGGQTLGTGGNGQGGAVIHNGGLGAWCIRDYSTNTFTSGTGPNSRPAAQVCILEKLIY